MIGEGGREERREEILEKQKKKMTVEFANLFAMFACLLVCMIFTALGKFSPSEKSRDFWVSA